MRGAVGARLPSSVPHEPVRGDGHPSAKGLAPGAAGRGRSVGGGVHGDRRHGVVAPPRPVCLHADGGF